MSQKRKQEVLDAGYGVVVTGDRTYHRTGGDCWSDDDHLIGLADAEEANAHGYAPCAKCYPDQEEA